MGLRLVGKAIVISMRTRRRFIPFVVIYVALIVWLSYNLEAGADTEMLIISFGATVLISLLYTQIIIYNRKKEIITLKCIGWTNSDIRTLLLGEVMWVTVVGFLIVFEILIHHAAVVSYYWHQNISANQITSNALAFYENTKPFLSIPNILITFGLFILAQLAGVFMIYKQIAKLRPIVTMRVMK